MSTLYYASANTISKDKVYTMIHNCKKCPYNTKSWFFIQNHVRQHIYRRSPLVLFNCSTSNLENFVCEECNFTTFLVAKFREHIENHSVKSEDVEGNLQELIKDTDSVSEIYGCNEIDSKRFTIQNLEWFQCNECSHKSKDKSNLKRHIINQHRPADIKWFQCDECTYKSKQKFHLRKHIINQHRSADIKWFQCDKCSYKTKLKQSLKEHITKKHGPAENIKWFQCDKCTFRSNLKSNLQRHIINKHGLAEDIKWFQCDECTYKSKRKDNLKRHILHLHRSADM